MKLRQLVIFAIMSSAIPLVQAQDAAPSTVDLQPPRNEPASPSATPPPPVNPSEVPELSKLDEAFKQTSLGKAADEYRQRIELRRLQNQAMNDPAVVAARAASESARTDLEKRERLRDYYNVYYGRMRSMTSNAEMKSALDSFKTEHLKLLDQPRVRPVPGAPPPVETGKKKETKPKKSRFGVSSGQ